MLRRLLFLFCLWFPVPVLSVPVDLPSSVQETIEPSTAPVAEIKAEPEPLRLRQEPARSEVGSMGSASLQMVIGLAMVLAIITGMAWLARRFGPAGMVNASTIKVSAATSVGQKEKLLVVEVDNKRLLLGVTAQQISLLQTLEEAPEKNTGDSDFANRIQSLLKTGSVHEK